MKAQSTFSLKDQLFNAEKVDYLATLLEGVFPDFGGEAFRASVLSAFPVLELKERIAHITATLHTCLPPRYRDALAIILEALPPELDPNRTDDDYGDFIFAPFSLFVATYGRTAEHLEVSLDALRHITKRFSAEDAVRYFLNAFPAETLDFLRECAGDDNYHVRRLASESSRPLLPWAQRLTIDYREPLPILDVLFSDGTRYVTRSVANHLNDISKLDPELVVETLRRWRDDHQQTPAEMQFITKHALRTLVKRGHVEALELIGFGGEPDVTIVELATNTPQVRIGEAFRFSLTLTANSRQKLLLDYLMKFAGDGRVTRQKVFKLKQVELDAQQSISLAKAHPMRLMTTRRLQAGEHQITLLVNGIPQGTLVFDLVVA
jgi:3-methyladenine DNA glycosylase AlkC